MGAKEAASGLELTWASSHRAATGYFLGSLVHTATALFGLMALASSSTDWIKPFLSTTKVVRWAQSYSSFWTLYIFRMPYSLSTLRFMSLSNGKVTPIFWAKALLAAGLSILIPKTTASEASSLAISA